MTATTSSTEVIRGSTGTSVTFGAQLTGVLAVAGEEQLSVQCKMSRQASTLGDSLNAIGPLNIDLGIVDTC